MSIRAYSKAKDGATFLSKNFRVREFACQDGTDPVFVDMDLVDILQRIRDHFGVAVTITSAVLNRLAQQKCWCGNVFTTW